MTRDNLLQIARRFGLFTDSYLFQMLSRVGLKVDSVKRWSPSDIVDAMRDAAHIEQIEVGERRPRRDGQAIAFSVSFEYGDPNIAARVANEFVTLILQQNIQSRTNRAAETHKFFDQQVSKLNQQLVALEVNIAKFKGDNQAALPESIGFRHGLLMRLQSEISEIDRKVATLQEERALWQQRAQIGSGGTALDPNDRTTAAELHRLRTQFVQLRAVYSDTHPDVRKTKAQIAALENATSIEASDKSSASEAAKENSNATGASVEPRVSDQVTVIEKQLEVLRSQRSQLLTRVSSLDESLLRTPQVEAALNALTREHQTIQSQMAAARAKMAEAATGERLEEDRQAERFEVIEQASPPDEPAKPDRQRIILGGLFLSFAIGVGFVVLLEMLDKSIRSSAALEKYLQLRPLAIVPYVITRSERRFRKLKINAFLTLSVTSVIVALVVIHNYYLPLQLIIQKVTQRL